MTILNIIGNTPLLSLDVDGLKEWVKLFAKAEFMNSSVKDRATMPSSPNLFPRGQGSA